MEMPQNFLSIIFTQQDIKFSLKQEIVNFLYTNINQDLTKINAFQRQNFSSSKVIILTK